MSAGSGVIHPSGRHQRGGPHPGVSHLTRIDTSTPRFGYRGVLWQSLMSQQRISLAVTRSSYERSPLIKQV